MKIPLLISLTLHGMLIFLAISGMPQTWIKRDFMLLPPIEVEMISEEELAALHQPEERAMEEEVPPPPAPVPPVRPPPPLQAETAAEPVRSPPRPAPPAPPEVSAPIADARAPTPIAAPPPIAPSPAPPPPDAPRLADPPPPPEPTESELIAQLDRSPIRPLPSPRPPPRQPEAPAPPDVPVTRIDLLDSILVDLAQEDTKTPPAPPPPDPISTALRNVEQTALPQRSSAQRANLQARIESAISAQLDRNVLLPVGAKNLDEYVLRIRLEITRDRHVRGQPLILNADAHPNDPVFEVLKRNTINGIFKSQPLDLPEDEYEYWKNMTINYRPRRLGG